MLLRSIDSASRIGTDVKVMMVMNWKSRESQRRNVIVDDFGLVARRIDERAGCSRNGQTGVLDSECDM